MKYNVINSIKTLVLVLLFFQVNSSATTKPKYEEGKVYRHILENGMTVLTMERHIAPLIYHQLTYKVGSRNERLGITGISHIVEHMMFKGTEKYGKGAVSKIISKNSGIFNAFTSNDMTSYYEYMPKNKIEIAFDIESDRMQNSIFDPEEFKSEIEVIIQERRMRSESSAAGILREELNAVAYSSHPNRDPIIGWPSDLRNITRDEAFDYYKTYYTPNNAFLVLIGDFETDEILKTVNKYYGKIPKGPEVKEIWAVQEPQKVRKSLTLYHTDITSPSLRMSFHVPTYENPDAAALRIAGMILCEKSRDARLYKLMVEKQQIASSVAGGFGMSKDPSLFSISCTLKPDSSVDRAEAIIWEQIKKMQTEDVTDHELQKVKNRYKFNQVTSYTKNADIGGRVSRYETYFGWDFFFEFDKRMLAVTKEDIKRVMNTYFNPTQVTLAYTFPKEGEKPTGKKSVDEEATDETENLYLEEEDKFYFQPPSEAFVITEAIASNTLDEIIKPMPIAPLIKTMSLKNGVKLYTLEDRLVPALTVVGIIETGYIPENLEGEQPGIANFLTDVMNRGTKELNYDQISERMAFVPFQFSVSGSYRGFYFQGYSLLENVDEMMTIGYDLVTQPPLRQEDIDKLKPRHIIAAKNRYKKTGIKAFYDMFNNLFEGHPITKFNSNEESIKSIKRDELVSLHKKYFTPKNLTILMVGDMTPEQMKEIADKYFGNWDNPDGVTEIPITPAVNNLNKKVIKVFPEKDYTECTINIGFSPYNNIDPDETEIVSVLNYILSSSALTSRIGVELRDKQGLIYGIKSELWTTSDNFGYWKFNTKTGPENTKKVIGGIFKEIRKLINEGITDEELQTAKNRLTGLLPFFVETTDDVAQRVFDMIKENKPFDYFDKKADRILAVSKDDVLRIAQKYFTLDQFYIVIDGPIEENALTGFENEL